MDDKFAHELPTMEGPATYQICVQGRLDTKWSDRLGGMSITVRGGVDVQDITLLEGRLSDQAALSGILNTLYELHMPVLSLECINAE